MITAGAVGDHTDQAPHAWQGGNDGRGKDMDSLNELVCSGVWPSWVKLNVSVIVSVITY